ncbi:MAG: outer membrane beta-barrel protein [Bacteroidota bacterium]
MLDKPFDSDPQEDLRQFADASVTPAPALWDKLEAQLDWDDEVQTTLSSASQTPPPAVWEAIEKALDGNDDKPAILLWWRWAAAVLLLALLGVITFYWRNTQTHEDLHVDKEQIQQKEQSVDKAFQQEESKNPSSTEEKIYTPEELEGNENNNIQRTTDTSTASRIETSTEKQTTIQPQLNPIITTTDAVESSIVTTPNTNSLRKTELVSVALVELERVPMVFAPKTLIFPLDLQARTSPASAEKMAVTLTPKWFINARGGGGQFLPNYSGTFAQGSISVLGADGDDLQEVLTGNLQGTSRTFGLEVGRNLGKRWVLVSGLNYIRTNYSAQTEFYNDIPTPLLSDPFFRQYANAEFEYQQEHLSIPLYLGYQIGDGRLSALIMSGLSTDILLSEAVQASDLPDGYAYSLGNTKGTNLNFLLGTQLQYAVLPSRRLKITLDGRYESAFSSNLDASDATQIPERYQAQLGLRWDF